MSTPIKICRFAKALHDEEEFKTLVRDMAFNFSQPAYSIIKCDHSPQCKPLSKEDETLIKQRVLKAVKEEHGNPNAKWLY